mmetsp:Transcript_34478/g.97254  ORF Transcript_34478/g.97254 Transcript_34478/m.97254 type:complete len:281 (+) Transcript_34478:241-1083(+)
MLVRQIVVVVVVVIGCGGVWSSNPFDHVPVRKLGNPCVEVCMDAPYSPECASCCRQAPHRVPWNCDETGTEGGDGKGRRTIGETGIPLFDQIFGQAEGTLRSAKLAYSGHSVSTSPVDCCTSWTAECWEEAIPENNFHACAECCGDCTCAGSSCCSCGCLDDPYWECYCGGCKDIDGNECGGPGQPASCRCAETKICWTEIGFIAVILLYAFFVFVAPAILCCCGTAFSIYGCVTLCRRYRGVDVVQGEEELGAGEDGSEEDESCDWDAKETVSSGKCAS